MIKTTLDIGVCDLEITATVVKLVRAAVPGTKAADIMEDVKRAYPEADESQIKRCMRNAADLMGNQHNSW